jgi:hypothetical protein
MDVDLYQMRDILRWLEFYRTQTGLLQFLFLLLFRRHPLGALLSFLHDRCAYRELVWIDEDIVEF